MGIEPEKDINVSVTNKNMDSSKSSGEDHIKPKIENLLAILIKKRFFHLKINKK